MDIKKIFMVILCIFFILISGCNYVAATVNGEKIFESDIEGILNREKKTNPQQFEGSQGKTQEEKMKKEILEALIDLELMYQEAKKQGIKVTDKEVEDKYNELIKQYKSEDEFRKQFLETMGISVQKTKEYLKKGIYADKFQKQIIKEPSVSDEEAEKYYNENKDSFKNESGEIKPFDEAKDDVINAVKSSKTQQAMMKLINELKKRAKIVYSKSYELEKSQAPTEKETKIEKQTVK